MTDATEFIDLDSYPIDRPDGADCRALLARVQAEIDDGGCAVPRGRRPRYVGIFSFVEDPRMVGTPERIRQLHGKVLPIHLERAGQRSDGYID